MRTSFDGKKIESGDLESDIRSNPKLLSSLAPAAKDVAPQGQRVLNLAGFKKLGIPLPKALQQIEIGLMIEALEECKGNQNEAAVVLGLNRTTYTMKFRELRNRGINPLAYRVKAQASAG